jgi:hypothetical protein
LLDELKTPFDFVLHHLLLRFTERFPPVKSCLIVGWAIGKAQTCDEACGSIGRGFQRISEKLAATNEPELE